MSKFVGAVNISNFLKPFSEWSAEDRRNFHYSVHLNGLKSVVADLKKGIIEIHKINPAQAHKLWNNSVDVLHQALGHEINYLKEGYKIFGNQIRKVERIKSADWRDTRTTSKLVTDTKKEGAIDFSVQNVSYSEIEKLFGSKPFPVKTAPKRFGFLRKKKKT
ncbi:MAG: hypothetical protein JW703_05460 [Candidatus Diapherotrites archaeon]|nr:hypothetical protein [Candidatus Diapherotrites archaeon]